MRDYIRSLKIVPCIPYLGKLSTRAFNISSHLVLEVILMPLEILQLLSELKTRIWPGFTPTSQDLSFFKDRILIFSPSHLLSTSGIFNLYEFICFPLVRLYISTMFISVVLQMTYYYKTHLLVARHKEAFTNLVPSLIN